MSFKARPLFPKIVVCCVILTAACVATADSQTLRERLQARAEQRRADAAQTGDAVSSSDAQTMTVMQDGRERMFLVHVPTNLSANPGVVMAFHGGGGNAARTMEMSGLNAAADQRGFLAVYPDSGGERWNDGRAGTADGSDDVGFIRAVVAELQQNYGADPTRIFATGMSNGGIFVHNLACKAPDLVAAIAPVSANMPQALRASCAPAQATPVMMFSGTEDPLMPYLGGKPELEEMLQRAVGPTTDEMTSSPDTAQFWAGINGCGTASPVDLGDASDDGTTVTEFDFTGCTAGQVTLFRINGGGHAWPGTGVPGRRITGAVSQDISATGQMIQFFVRNGL